MARFELARGQTSRAIEHRTVDEIWYVVQGHGQMWRSQEDRSEIVDLEVGTCVTIPVGTRFQFRASASESLAAVAVTMPPWPGDDEALFVDGCPAWRVVDDHDVLGTKSR